MCTAVLAVMGAVSSIAQGRAAQSAAKAQAAAAEQNARLEELRAEDAVKRAGTDELMMRRDMSRLAGRQRAAAAAMGVSPDEGSPLDIQLESMDEYERDIAANALNAQREAWGHNVNAANYRNQAAAAIAAGKNAMTAGIINAGTGLLSLAAPKVDMLGKGIKVTDKTNAKLYKGVSTSAIYQNYGI